MHTFQTADVPLWLVHHNGDFSGDVIITNFDTRGVSKNDKEITVPFELLKQLVAEYVRREKIASLEQAEAHHILGTID